MINFEPTEKEILTSTGIQLQVSETPAGWFWRYRVKGLLFWSMWRSTEKAYETREEAIGRAMWHIKQYIANMNIKLRYQHTQGWEDVNSDD